MFSDLSRLSFIIIITTAPVILGGCTVPTSKTGAMAAFNHARPVTLKMEHPDMDHPPAFSAPHNDWPTERSSELTTLSAGTGDDVRTVGHPLPIYLKATGGTVDSERPAVSFVPNQTGSPQPTEPGFGATGHP